MKQLAALGLAISLAFIAFFASFVSFAHADPSATGLENRASEFSPTRTGQDKIHSVPEGGNTLALLAIGVAGVVATASLGRSMAKSRSLTS